MDYPQNISSSSPSETLNTDTTATANATTAITMNTANEQAGSHNSSQNNFAKPQQQQQQQQQQQPEPQQPQRREDESIVRRRSQLSWMLEHVLFPSLRSRLVATNDLVRGVVEVADLKGLYKVFERC
ncbi:hypothetical protein ACJ72_08457 [Emergomyces africanus]|uniref:DNA mismatch repair protein Mlh1 C-terminal domain-containing protein n=1 Tax=Emergomyces africanus TaxID=1955775 RepID=A0A1B7NKU2_9EURO|nr:hypothetical protein ACJ72_08457 [Emergomyces africanus]